MLFHFTPVSLKHGQGARSNKAECKQVSKGWGALMCVVVWSRKKWWAKWRTYRGVCSAYELSAYSTREDLLFT